jgi:hypothetical protein
VAFVAVDVFKLVRPATIRGQQAYEADYNALTGLQKLARDLTIAIIVVHHTRKADSDDLIDKVSGTFGLGCRYVGLTPHNLQDFIVNYDQGNPVSPIIFTLKPAFITRAGRKRRHTPTNDELKDVGLRVADEQPHIPAPAETTPAQESCLADVMAQDAPVIERRESALAKAEIRRAPRVARARISATKPDGSIPVTLGGRLPPVSVLSRREFGLRQLRK